VKCKSCGAALDLTMASCPACGAQVELGRLTGILGIVCRACDAYNEPRAKTCVGCGKPLGAAAEPPAPAAAPAPPVPAAPTAPAPPAARPAAPAPPARPPQPAPPARPAASARPPASAVPPPPAPAPPAPAGGPVVRSFQKPAGGAATRFVPSVLRPSAQKPAPGSPALTPIPLVTRCPRCGAEAGLGRFCSQCGQALGARGTQVIAKPPPAARTSTQVFGALAQARATLVLEAADGAGARFRLDADTVEAGRAKGAIVFPDDPCLAPHHATFLLRDGALRVRDEGARGGIYVRLREVAVPLRAGDHFAVGERLLRYAGLLPSPPTPPPDGTARLGSPRPASPAVVLEEWLEGGAGGRVFVRSGPSVTIGRAGCAVSLGDDPLLSQEHAEIAVEQDGTARLRDLGSSNGTYVRVPPRGERELRDGDFVRMGHEVLRVAME
jgi:pSer/pThr/pTyr-binding forkhead associated (FHA) protein